LCGAGCKTRTYRANLAEAGTELQSGFAQICICFGERNQIMENRYNIAKQP
jgi:hypothetical protein